MIKLGSTDMAKAYVGSTEVSKMYLGSDLVYQNTPPEPLPYDAEIEYLQTDKTAYIDVGIAPASIATPVMEGRFYKENPSTAYYICGSDALTPGRFSFAFLNSNRIEMRLGNYVQYSGNPVGWYTLKISCVDNGMYINGTKKGTASDVGADNERSTATILIFTIHNANHNLGTMRYNLMCSSFKLWSNTTLLRDMIPVRVGQVGYMYDKVSKQLFGNAAGSGAFILGNDI